MSALVLHMETGYKVLRRLDQRKMSSDQQWVSAAWGPVWSSQKSSSQLSVPCRYLRSLSLCHLTTFPKKIQYFQDLLTSESITAAPETGGRQGRVLIISPSYRQVSRTPTLTISSHWHSQVRRYPLFSSQQNQIDLTPQEKIVSKPSESSTLSSSQQLDTEIDQVATFLEQSSIDEVIEEIREIENTISEEEQDLASLVKLRTVNLGFNQNKVSDEPNRVTAYDEEEKIDLNLDLRT